MGFAGMVKDRVAVGITDHASIGCAESLIDPSMSMVPGVGQYPLPPVPVTQQVFVVVQSLCLPVFVATSLMIRVSWGYLFQYRAPTPGVRVLRSAVGATRFVAAFERANAGDVACIEVGNPFPFPFAISHSLPESVGRVLVEILCDT
jgi:hypothetical protein